ncbi:leucine-rich repeat and coiled-coil domain-containing protein 1 [Bombina bombina]|uniref:leucine-rich repeat and coiled-coil domain-containing protein 1 n=1 Tax=Bombina bombina TaxID=8345 RepID=UPI00235A7987|nr:leucine-rich repeat and coiled-coil domain-containing protein 1 [Bombina bombina]
MLSSLQMMSAGEPSSRELSLMDKQVTSLLEISLNCCLHSLNLHCNQISKIEGLGHLYNLQYLDLSSNLITKIEGLDSLPCLHSLNLSCNKLIRVEGLEKLLNLKKLNLSYNRIHDLSGLISLHGRNHQLSHLYLHSNCINNIEHALECVVGFNSLLYVSFEQSGKGNPICNAAGYREKILQNLPQLKALDGINQFDESVIGLEGDSVDFQNMDFLEYLFTFDNESRDDKGSVTTPRIDQVLSQYKRKPAMSVPGNFPSDTDATFLSEQEIVKHQDPNNTLREMRLKKLEDQISELIEKTSSAKSQEPKNILKAKRDTDLTSESDCESVKENQRNNVAKRSQIPYRKSNQTAKHQVSHPSKSRTLSSSAPKQNSTRKPISACPQKKGTISTSLSSDRIDTDSAEQISGRHCSMQRSQKGKTQEAFSSIEESTYRALVQELDQERERRWKAEQVVLKLTENLKELQSQAKEEKDINSMAVYTTDRIKELFLKEKNAKTKLQGIVHQMREENERLTNELKQFARKEDDYKVALKNMEEAISKLETQHLQQQALENKLRKLEFVAEEEKRKTVQIELLKQEKSKLISQLTAQESLIDGLKAERKIWGQELTQQGVSLAQDRGRLEAKIEVLSNEVEMLKKQNERDNDALRIKCKVVDDQTETIRKLKEGLQERDERIRKLREENIEAEKALSEQNDNRTMQVGELKEKLERQTERKEELKQLLEEREAELEDMKKAYSAMNKKWQDKAELLSLLETQVRQMKENFDAKEKKLIEERDKSLQSQKSVTEKFRSVDDAFRRQLESILAAHQAELIKLSRDKQREVDSANEKVYQVEEEMRQLLKETANNKKAMEEKIRRLTSALSDIQQEL